jgi:4a-hydroxytetrahydrobiopterin dehydratase
MTEALAGKPVLPVAGEYLHSRASKLSSFTHRPPDWQLADEAHRIERSFRFRNFREPLTFLPNIRELARV